MARITVEDCLVKENNRFSLVHLAFRRAKQLLRGAKPVIEEGKSNKSVVMSLREIAEGKVRFMTEEEFEESKRKAKEIAEHAPAIPTREMLAAQVIFESNGGNSKGSKDGDDDDDEI